VGGLVASSLNLSNADFIAGRKNFVAGAVAGKVSNDGRPHDAARRACVPARAQCGQHRRHHLAAGQVILAAGHSVQLVDSNDPNMQVVVSAPDNAALTWARSSRKAGRWASMAL